MKLKEKIKQWLFKDELDKLNSKIKRLDSNYDWLKTVTANSVDMFNKAKGDCNDATEICKQLQKTINNVCDVGVDVGFRDNYHSWAVICVHGKTEFVKFMPFNQSDIYTIRKFLKQFEYCKDRVRVDSPFTYENAKDFWF